VTRLALAASAVAAAQRNESGWFQQFERRAAVCNRAYLAGGAVWLSEDFGMERVDQDRPEGRTICL
jgi:hypothetical protein